MIYGILTLLLCVGIPLGGAVYFGMKRQGTFSCYVVGALCFSISQLILRIPLMNYLSLNWEWYSLLPYTNYFLYVTLTVMSAGVFEEIGRWIFLKALCKGKTDWSHGLAFGLGHGGIEAVYIASLSVIPAFFNGTISLAGPDVILVGLERLCAMCFHIAMTMVVLKGIRENRFRYCLLAVLIHGVFDFTVIIPVKAVIWALLVLAATLSLIYTLYEKQRLDAVSRINPKER